MFLYFFVFLKFLTIEGREKRGSNEGSKQASKQPGHKGETLKCFLTILVLAQQGRGEAVIGSNEIVWDMESH